MPDAARTVLRMGAAFLVVAGLIAVVFAIRPPGSGTDRTPVAVQPGASVQLPRPGLFGGRLTLYGRVAEGAEAPTGKQLGCTLTRPGGQSGQTFDLAWASHGPQTVSGQRLTALVSLPRYPAGTTFGCTGSAAPSAAPLYLLGGGLNAGLMRVMLVGFAVVAFVVGGAALVVLRPRTRR